MTMCSPATVAESHEGRIESAYSIFFGNAMIIEESHEGRIER